MGKYTAWVPEEEAKQITNKLIDKYHELFGHIQTDKIAFIKDCKKQSDIPIKIKSVKFPESIWIDEVYILTVFDDCWGTLEPKQRNLAVAQALCSIHKEGFGETSKNYGKIIKPDIVSYLEIYAMAGGVPNFLQNPSAVDPLASDEYEGTEKEDVGE